MEEILADGRLKRLFGTLPAALAALALLAIPGAAAAQDKDLGAHRDWNAQTYAEGGSKVCNVWSKPKKEEGNYSRRGEVFAFVAHRPGEGRRNEVSFQIGYTFKNGSELSVQIGGRTFSLFTEGGSAWLRSVEEDDAIVAAMKAGSTMIIRGTSSRGTATKDTFSLSGFTAAMNAIDRECGG